MVRLQMYEETVQGTCSTRGGRLLLRASNYLAHRERAVPSNGLLRFMRG